MGGCDGIPGGIDTIVGDSTRIGDGTLLRESLPMTGRPSKEILLKLI
jgi:hypothetical protein